MLGEELVFELIIHNYVILQILFFFNKLAYFNLILYEIEIG